MTEKEREEIEKIKLEEYTYHFFFNHGLFDALILLEDLVNETQVYLTEKIKIHSNDPVLDPSDLRFDKHTLFSSHFPHVIWRSLLLYMYSLMEASLDEICNNLEKEKNYTLSLQDMNGSGISRSSLYLSKVANIPAPFSEGNWQRMKYLKLVRNCLIHSDGRFLRKDKRLIKACNALKLNYLESFDSELSIEINYDSCISALKLITELFKSIHNSMQKLRWPDRNFN